jgi:hypothetical protein
VVGALRHLNEPPVKRFIATVLASAVAAVLLSLAVGAGDHPSAASHPSAARAGAHSKMAQREIAASRALATAGLRLRHGHRQRGEDGLTEEEARVYTRIPTPSGFKGTGFDWRRRWPEVPTKDIIATFEQNRAACEWFRAYARTDPSKATATTAAAVIAYIPSWPEFRPRPGAPGAHAEIAAAATDVESGAAARAAGRGTQTAAVAFIVRDLC